MNLAKKKKNPKKALIYASIKKYFGINLTIEVKDLNVESYKTLTKLAKIYQK